MNKKLILAVIAALCMTGCGNKTQTDVPMTDSTSVDSTAAESDDDADDLPIPAKDPNDDGESHINIKQDNYIHFRDNKKHEDGTCVIEFEYQRSHAKNALLMKSLDEDVTKFMTQYLDDDNIKCNNIYEAYDANKNAIFNDEDMTCHVSYEIISLPKFYGLYTYIFNSYSECEGSAHGSASGEGCTYNKQGERLTWNMFNKNAALHKMLMDKLKEYFNVKTDAELFDALSPEDADKIENVPYPESAPCLNDKGHLVFTYQQYEVACYAAGMPSAEFTLEEIKPYLTEEGKTFFGL